MKPYVPWQIAESCPTLFLAVSTLSLLAAPLWAASTHHSDPPAFVKSSTPELTILRKELNAFCCYGVLDNHADILYSGESDHWHFDLSASGVPTSIHEVEVRLALVLDDHYGQPEEAYVGRVLTNNAEAFSGGFNANLGIVHGSPFAGPFQNWQEPFFQTDNGAPSPYTVSIENNSSLPGTDWIAIDYIELYLYTTQAVSIDIKPGSDPNCFNVNSQGVIPVAILGSSDFDVSEIDALSLTFDGLAVRVRGKRGPLCSEEDSNGDGYWDLVCHFEDDAEYWVGGGDSGTVTGILYDGSAFEGTDTICVVPE